MWAAGAQEVVQESRYAHLVGAARMGKDPASSVVDQYCRTHDISNLFVCDGSVSHTGSANPGLTIQALAARTADYLISQGETIFRSGPRYDAAASQARARRLPRYIGEKGSPALPEGHLHAFRAASRAAAGRAAAARLQQLVEASLLIVAAPSPDDEAIGIGAHFALVKHALAPWCM